MREGYPPEPCVQPPTQKLSDSIDGHTRAWFFEREVFGGQERSGWEVRDGHHALREQIPERTHLLRQQILVDRMAAHFLDEPDAFDEPAKLFRGHARRDVRPRHVPAQGHMHFEGIDADHGRGETRVNSS